MTKQQFEVLPNEHHRTFPLLNSREVDALQAKRFEEALAAEPHSNRTPRKKRNQREG